jgi:glycosyltransferase involved in cell wall biosynthesis
MPLPKLGARTNRDWFWWILARLARISSKPVARLLRKFAPSFRNKLQPTLFRFYAWLSHNQGFTVVRPDTEPAGLRPRLLIDVSTTFHLTQVTGIQRTVRSLTAALQRNGHRYKFEPVPVRLKRSQDAKLILMMARGFPNPGEEQLVVLRPGDCLFMLDSSWDIYRKWAAVLFPMVRARGGKVVTCVYDILPITHPEFFTSATLKMFRPWYKSAIAESDALFAISEATRQELLHRIGDTSVPTEVFHLGADFAPGQRLASPGSGDKSIISFLMVGTIEPRKGHSTVLTAFQMLWASGMGVRLVFVGRPGWKVAELIARLEELSVTSELFDYYPSASDEKLAQCYNEADAVIAASLAEGFGLPLVETLLLGKPLIASDIPAFREVAGGLPTYFEPGNPASLAAAVRALLADGSRSSEEFPRWITWDQSADQLMEKVEKLCAAGSWDSGGSDPGERSL